MLNENWKTRRQRDSVEFTHSLRDVYGKAADDLHRRQQDPDLEDASLDRIEIAAEARMDKVLVIHNNGAVAVTGPIKVTEHTVRVCRDGLDEWRFGVCRIECQNERGESTLQNTVDQTR